MYFEKICININVVCLSCEFQKKLENTNFQHALQSEMPTFRN